MVAVGSPVIPFVPGRPVPYMRVEDGPRQTPLHVRAGADQGAEEPGARNVMGIRPERGASGFQARVNHGFLAQLMAEEQGAAGGKAIHPPRAMHRRAFAAYQSAHEILNTGETRSLLPDVGQVKEGKPYLLEA